MYDSTQNFTGYCKQVARGLRQLTSFRLSYLRKVFSFMGKTERAVVFALCVIGILSLGITMRNFYLNHTVEVPGSGGILVEGMVGQPSYINPLLAHSDIDLALTQLVYSGLYKYDGSGNLVPDLADGQPLISQDQKQYTINLRKDVRWQNDRPFNADDVVFTVQMLQDPAYKSPLRSLWQATTVEKTGDYQVRFTTKDVSGPFIYHLTLPIMPKSVWSRVEAQNFVLSNNNLSAIGSGPYAIKEIKKLESGTVQEITLNAFSGYYQTKPKISTLIVKFYDQPQDAANALHSKEINALGLPQLDEPVQLASLRQNVNTYSIPLPQYQVLFFNLNNKILSDLAVRQALSLATNKQEIIDKVFGGQAVIPNSTPDASLIGIPDNSNTYNPDQAADILNKAGWIIDSQTGIRTKKSQPFEITIFTNDSTLNAKAAETLAEQWQKLNVKVSVTVLPTKQLTDNNIRPRNFDVLIFSQKLSPDLDPFIFWHSSQTKDPGWNITGFTSADADKLITQMRATTDLATRKQQYQNFNTFVSQQTPVLFLNQAVYTYVLDSKIKNVDFSMLYGPEQRFNDIANWYMQNKRVWK